MNSGAIKPASIFKDHYESPTDPSGQIKEGALGLLINSIKAFLQSDELEDAVLEELNDLDIQ